MAHDNEEKEIGTSTEEEELAAFQLQEESDDRRDRNEGKSETSTCTRPVLLCFVSVVNHLAMWIYGQWRRSLPKTRVSHRDLRMICTIPLDILYEVCLSTLSTALLIKPTLSSIQIFEHLHPIDLYHISRTNRSFQDILSSPSSSSIWQAAYEREDEIPRCPEDISELEWADLLFGKRICQVG